MSVISFEILNKLNLETAGKSIESYSTLNGPWLNQFDNFYNNTRLSASPLQRMTDLLNIVRYNGWNMNRQGQCGSILKDICTGIITDDQLCNFWDLVDKLPNLSLCELPCADKSVIDQLICSFTKLRYILSGWHSSAGSVCFLTKVVLMFNWGHAPAYDTRIRSILGVDNSVSDRDLIDSLVEIGIWLRYFETRFDVDFVKFSTDVMRQASGLELNQLPSGRSFDMMLFSLRS
ncbi:MAG: hypothetical protein WB792_17205 [Desulfobacterales bacterium]|jgi:hypothetical protein